MSKKDEYLKILENTVGFTEDKVGSELIYDGRIIHVYRDAIRLPNGSDAVREAVRHIGAVCVVPVTDDGKVVLVRQFRYPFGKMIYEIPAGKLDLRDEEHSRAAMRELEEETGYICSSLEYIGDLYSTPGFCDEVIHMYCARGLVKGKPHPDEDGFIDTVAIPIEDVKDMILDGDITDSKTQAAVLKVYVKYFSKS